jgi:hypothetical protein
MPMVVRARSFPSHWWPPLLMVALFGAGVPWLTVRRRSRRRADPEDRARRESNARARPTLRARLKHVQAEPDLVALTARLRAWPGAEGEFYVADVIHALANRVWTPESGGTA